MKLNKFLINDRSTLRESLQKIELNHHGVIFVSTENGSVIGIVTDGDIRRHLLSGGSLEDIISVCVNKNFIWEKATTPRELLLKKLDNQIRVIPLLNESKFLIGIISRDNIPVLTENAIYARARAPVRISFSGGGSDLTHYFCNHENGAVINTTISLYSHCLLRLRNDTRISIYSRDLNQTLRGEDLQEILSKKGEFSLIQALIKTINPEFGFELSIHSDFPMKSGLGGSAAISASILGCFNQFRRDQWDSYELAELAYQAERHYLRLAGGWQDQYAAVFGGFNFMEFRMDQNIIHPLRIHSDILLELEESLILCDTGIAHDSGDIHNDQRDQMNADAIRNMVHTNVQLSYQMRNDLLRGNLLNFGKLLDKSWEFKRQFSKKITSPYLDKIYDKAKSSGAIGGKLLGAGGGGFFLFYVPHFRMYELMSHLCSSDLKIQRFRFEQQGLQTWIARECKNHKE